MKKIHGRHSIQPLTIHDDVVADDARIQEHKILFSISPSDILAELEALKTRVTVLETTATSLDARVTALENYKASYLDPIVSSYSSLVTTVNGLSTAISDMETTIQDISNRFDAVETAVTEVSNYLNDVRADIDSLVESLRKSPSFIVCPEYPNGVLAALGETAILGLMHTDYDPSIDKTYFEWSSTDEEDMQRYCITFKHWFPTPPTGKRIGIMGGTLFANLVGASELRLKIFDAQGSEVIFKNITATDLGWVSIILDPADITALNTPTLDWEFMRVELRLSAMNSGNVRVADFILDAEFVAQA